MKSAYRDLKWVEANQEKETGDFQEYLFECAVGQIQYRFFKKFAGVVNECDYYDIASYRGAEGPYIMECANGKEVELIKQFKKTFKGYCEKKRIIAEFAKLDPWDDYAKVLRENLNAEYYGNYYCNNLQIDFYAEEYNRNCKRAIKKARNQGVEVMIDHEGNTIPEFIELYKNTEDKFNTTDYYRFTENDIKRFFEIYGEDAFLINALYQNEIVTSVFVVMGEDVVHYLFLGNNPNYLNLQCNGLLTYEAALYGKNRGRKIFDMGGGKPGGGIEKYKRNFISDDGVWEYYAIKKIYNKEIYDELVRQKGKITNEHFFPLYRG